MAKEIMGDLANLIRRVVVFLLVDNWRITLVMVIGAAAIYLLLPRPRGQKTLYGAGLGLLAVLLAGALLVGTRTVDAESFLFYAFSATAVIAGSLLVTQRNPARAALSFALVVLSTCGLFLLLAAPFLMAATAIIYAGAIVVTFLFVLMLAQQEGPSDADYRSREPMLSAIAGFILLGVLLYVLKTSYDTGPIRQLLLETDQLIVEMDAALTAKVPKTSDETLRLLDRAEDLLNRFRLQAHRQNTRDEYELLSRAYNIGTEAYSNESDLQGMRDLLQQVRGVAEELPSTVGLLKPASSGLSELSGPASSRPPSELRRDSSGRPPLPAENTAYLGRSLFTDYLLAVELGGTLLLVATIGAIAIATRRSSLGNGRGTP
jgi:NADH:ubiquinone oxidoreductase subunit 6 (subunit J)